VQSDEDAEQLKSTEDAERLTSPEDDAAVVKENVKQENNDDDAIDGEDKFQVLAEKSEATEVCRHISTLYMCSTCLQYVLLCLSTSRIAAVLLAVNLFLLHDSKVSRKN